MKDSSLWRDYPALLFEGGKKFSHYLLIRFGCTLGCSLLQVLIVVDAMR